jgi:phosphatidylglycerophosphatase A
MKDHFVKLIATGLYSGYTPLTSGTFGTIPAVAITWLFIGDNLVAASIAAIATFVVSVWAATEAEKLLGHDSKKIVIDEWAGWFFTVLVVPVTWPNMLIAFVAFRFFDVVKLWPAHRLEAMPRGWGVTLDDIAAGIQANIVTHLIIYIWSAL